MTDRQTDKVLGKAFNLNTKTFVCVLFPKAKRAKKSETLRSVRGVKISDNHNNKRIKTLTL